MKQRKSKNTDFYNSLKLIPEKESYVVEFPDRPSAEKFRRTALIYLARQMKDSFTTSVNPKDEDKFEVVFYNYPKALPEVT